jgi:hypothetical protein
MFVASAIGFGAYSHGSTPEHAALMPFLDNAARQWVRALFFSLPKMAKFAVEEVEKGVGAGAFLPEYLPGVVKRDGGLVHVWMVFCFKSRFETSVLKSDFEMSILAL